EPYALLVEEMAGEHDPLEIAAAAVHLAFEAGGPRREGAAAPAMAADGGPAEDGMARLYLDAGRRQGLRPQDVVGSFTAEADIPGSAIGTIDLFDDFAFVDVQRQAARKVLDRAANLVLRGRE